MNNTLAMLKLSIWQIKPVQLQNLRVEIMKGSTEVSYDQTTGKLRQTILKENSETEQMIKIVST